MTGRGGEPRRKTTTVDAYAPWQIRREHHLSAAEAFVLLVMVIQIDWRDLHWSWEGTLTDLSEDTGHTRETVGDAIAGLNTRGLIEIDRPFKRGTKGLVRIPVYPRLVRVTDRRRSAREALDPEHESSRHMPRADESEIAATSRRLRGHFAATSRRLRGMVAANPAKFVPRLPRPR